MSLHRQLQQRAAEGRPIRIGLIGAGKFGSMYLSQIPRTPGVHLVGIADLSPETACRNLARVGWDAQRVQAANLDAALRDGNTHVGDDWRALVRHPAIDIVVECTGNPIAAVDHCLEAFAQGKHVVNVTVEADRNNPLSGFSFVEPNCPRVGGNSGRVGVSSRSYPPAHQAAT